MDDVFIDITYTVSILFDVALLHNLDSPWWVLLRVGTCDSSASCNLTWDPLHFRFKGLFKEFFLQKSENTMELGGWVQVSLEAPK